MSRYLHADEMQRLRHLVFATRRGGEGHYAGRHASPQRGQSTEFNEYRSYMPGDPVNAIDWKVYARTDRLYVKQYEHQADLTVQLIMDNSASMAYRGMSAAGRGWQPLSLWRQVSRDVSIDEASDPAEAEPSKHEHACRLAAAIARLVTNQQDRVSLAIARAGLARHVPAAATQATLHQMDDCLEAEPLMGEADLSGAIEKLAPMLPRRAVVVIISDFLDEPDAVFAALQPVLQQGGEAIFFQVLHPDELTLPDVGEAKFVDSETGEVMSAHAGDLSQAYRETMAAFLERWSSRCRAHRVEHRLLRTDGDPLHALERYLYHRAAVGA